MLGAAPAFAHATLLGTDPPDRTTLATSPDSIALRFNEPVQTVFVRLLDQTGRVIAEAPTGGSADWVTVRPAAPLAPGQYLVSYRVVSEDDLEFLP